MVHSPRASWPGAAAGTAEERVRSPRDQPKPLAVQSAPRRRDAGARELRASRSNRLAAALDCQAEMLHALRRRTGPTDQAVDGKLDTAVRTRCARHESSKSPRAVHCPGAVVPLSTHSASLATCVAGGGKAPGQRFRRISAYRRLDCGQRLVKASDRLVRSSADLRKSDHTADSSGAAQFDGYVGSSAASPATHSLRKLSPSPPAHRSAAGALDPFSPQFAPR